MEEGPVLSAEVDIRSWFSPFDFPKLPEVIQAIDGQLPEDRLKVVKQLRGALLGLYKITSSDYNLYKDKTITIRGTVIPITLRRKQVRPPQEKPGVLVTIYDAFDEKAQAIPGARFNELFGLFDGVTFIRQTTPQFHKGTRILNGNRYLVLNFDAEKVDLGDVIQLDGFQFRIHYYGQRRMCYLCQIKHGSTCPEKEKFKELQAARDGKLTHKLYADSTLRKVNQLALSADVSCTSGAGIGQIANLIEQDPDKMEAVVIFAGANDISHTENDHQFKYVVDKSAEKLHKLASSRKVTLVLPATPRVTLEDEVKYTILKDTMSNVKSIAVIDIPQNTVEYEGIHPTTEGTKQLLGKLQQLQEMNIVLDPEYVTTERYYSQVSSYYKVGCRTCDDRQYTSNICGTCVEASKTVDISWMQEVAKEIYERANPPLDNTVDMKDILKRSLQSIATSNKDTDDNSGDAVKKVKFGDGL